MRSYKIGHMICTKKEENGYFEKRGGKNICTNYSWFGSAQHTCARKPKRRLEKREFEFTFHKQFRKYRHRCGKSLLLSVVGTRLRWSIGPKSPLPCGAQLKRLWFPLKCHGFDCVASYQKKHGADKIIFWFETFQNIKIKAIFVGKMRLKRKGGENHVKIRLLKKKSPPPRTQDGTALGFRDSKKLIITLTPSESDRNIFLIGGFGKKRVALYGSVLKSRPPPNLNCPGRKKIASRGVRLNKEKKTGEMHTNGQKNTHNSGGEQKKKETGGNAEKNEYTRRPGSVAPKYWDMSALVNALGNLKLRKPQQQSTFLWEHWLSWLIGWLIGRCPL